MTGSDGWDALLHWAKLVADVVDLDSGEREYKIQIATNLAQVRDLVRSNDGEWPSRLAAGLSPGKQNLLNWRFISDFLKNLDANRDQVRTALMAVWDHEPDAERLDEFVDLAASLPNRHSPGNLVSLGSVLLMAQEPTAFPPFRSTRVARWLSLVGQSAPKPAARASIRYQAMLTFFDDLLNRAHATGIGLRDRLDAQGLMWVATDWKIADIDPDDDWSPAQIRDFRLWRGEPDEHDTTLDAAQRAWLVRPRQGGADLARRWVEDAFVFPRRAIPVGHPPRVGPADRAGCRGSWIPAPGRPAPRAGERVPRLPDQDER